LTPKGGTVVLLSMFLLQQKRGDSAFGSKSQSLEVEPSARLVLTFKLFYQINWLVKHVMDDMFNKLGHMNF